MSNPFNDHFSAVAHSYAESRPTYPGELFAWLGALAPSRTLAWDCGCGSGQATIAIAPEFDNVVATDPSKSQLSSAPPTPGVIWAEATAESSGLPDNSVDAVITAQALHWFDIPKFWDEVRRVSRPAGVFMALSYAWQSTGDSELDRFLRKYAQETIGEYWPPERRYVETGYASIDFPFERLSAPATSMTANWDVGRQLGYMRSWSATRRGREELGVDPVAGIENELRERWGEEPRPISWPLTVLAGVVDEVA